MQMFVLDADPVNAASFLCDAHIRVIGREVTMQLSSWYYHFVPATRSFLPYRPMAVNQPLVRQLCYVPVRRWAIQYAGAVFKEYNRRFEKLHASADKYERLMNAIRQYDSSIDYGPLSVKFTFVEKGSGVFSGKSMSQAIVLYRDYYCRKIDQMNVPVKWTNVKRPEWLRQNF